MVGVAPLEYFVERGIVLEGRKGEASTGRLVLAFGPTVLEHGILVHLFPSTNANHRSVGSSRRVSTWGFRDKYLLKLCISEVPHGLAESSPVG